MKKLLTLLFTAAIVFSLAMPVFAGSGRAQDTTAKAKKTKAAAKTKKAKATAQKKTKEAAKQ